MLGPDGKPQAPDGSFSVITSKIQVSGQVAVMAINGRIAKTIFDKNPTREFYIEESFALDWMYPHLTPHGLIMKINRKPLGEISEEVVKKDHDHWSRQIKAMLGDALEYDTPLKSLVAFQEKIRIDGTMDGFKGDPLFLKDNWAQIAYSKMRSAQAAVYVWRMKHATNEQEKVRMAREADFAYRQAVSLCPTSPESVFGYANFLVEQKRLADAVLVADLAARMPPGANGRAGSFQQLAFQLEDLQKSAKPDK